MAYAIHEISAIGQVPALVASFATAQGWTVTNPSTGVFTVQRPGDLTALIFKITSAASGLVHDLIVTSDSDSTIGATVRGPIMNTQQTAGSAAFVTAPTKLHLIGRGNADGKIPFIAIVLEYGYNLYRHLYIGNMEKVGTYEGGEILGAANFAPIAYSSSYTNTVSDRFAAIPMFAWDYRYTSGGWIKNGGLRILSPESPVSWRQFIAGGTTSSPSGSIHLFASSTRNITAFGGVYDGCGGAMSIAGRSQYALASMTQAIPIYITAEVSGETRFRFVGYPAGMRTLNIEDVEPNTIFTVGNRQFFAVPIFRKSALTIVAQVSGLPSGQGFPPDNISAYMGYAYEID